MIDTASKFAAAMLAGLPLPLPVIDIHAHVAAYGLFHIPDPGPDAMVAVMDRLGVALTAISSLPAISADPSFGNDVSAAAVRDFPGRFTAFAVANPNYPDVVDELRRCFDTLDFRMIKLHPSVHRYRLTDPAYDAVFKFAGERGAPVLTHTWEDDPHCSIERAAEVARRYPEVTFIWGHAGALRFDRALDCAAELPGVYVDLACSQVYAGTVEHFLTRVPVEKLLFASDLPFLSLAQQVAKVAFSAVSDADKARILHDNAAGILARAGIPAS